MEYVKQEYPKWIPEHGVVANSEKEHQALREGRAILHTIKSAQGDTTTIVGIKEKK